MRLRTQILLFLLFIGLGPLFAAVAINLPLVLERLQLFYHKAYLQNLRADFRDLDQHLASREEMTRLLAKLPEPGALLGVSPDKNGREIDLSRARYTGWINQILQEQLDITQLIFLDIKGKEHFWLERNSETGLWQPVTRLPEPLSAGFFQAAMRLDRGGVLVSPIIIPAVTDLYDSRKVMALRLISPIGVGADGAWRPMGAVVMNIDLGGMARAYRNTLWVRSDGTYLVPPLPDRPGARPFEDFPGLDRIFAQKKLDLWEGEGRQVIWAPMFATATGEPLWVGRRVDPSPMAAFRNALIVRVLSIVLLLIVTVLLVARWAALRVERFGNELTDGIGRVLKDNEPVSFSWRGARELRALGRDLTQLGEAHSQHIQSLRQHAQALEESNRYKSQFLANVSHELRTPLNSILLLSKLLGDDKTGLSAEQAGQAKVIYEAGSDLRHLIDNILDLSRMEAGKEDVHLVELDLCEIIDEVMELMRPQFQAKGLGLELALSENLPQNIVSDKQKLGQILKNFLSNAVKFTTAGEVTLGVGREVGNTGSQGVLRISVADTGIGIPSEKQELIFEAFKQVDGSTSRRYGGTGLGLTISRELAQLIGGRIELESQAGQGATFSLLLPLAFEEGGIGEAQIRSRKQEPVSEVPASTVPEVQYEGQCVLLVDDDLKTLLAIAPLLEGWGLQVAAASDGAEALDTLEEETGCALVLMDVMVSGPAGYDTIGAIHALDHYHSLPIVALVSSTGAEDARGLAGYDDVVEKPVDTMRLKAILDRYLTV